MHGKIECTPSKHIPYVCQTKNNLHKFFYWLHLVYDTDYHQPMRRLRAMLLRLEQWRLMMPCASAAPRCGRRMQGCCRSHCAGSVADVGCWIVADAAVEGNATTIEAGVTG